MPEVSIREAGANESKLLSATAQRLFVQAYGDLSGAEDLAAHLEKHFSPRVVASELGNPEVRYYLASYGEAVAGFLKLRRGAAPDPVPAAVAVEVQQVYVDADHQRRGIGRLLMDRAVSVAAGESLDGVWLSVWEEADWAIRFYLAYGFHAVGKTDFWLGKTRCRDDLMWLPVAT